MNVLLYNCQAKDQPLSKNTEKWVSFSDLNQYGNVIGVVLENVSWHEVGGGTGLDFRVDLNSLYDSDNVRINIQLIGIVRHGKNILSPSKDKIIEKDDRLIVLAEHRKDYERVEIEVLKN